MIEDAQKQAGRTGQKIVDETLLLFASMAILTTEKYPQKNDDWEDRAEDPKTWADWKTSYKREHTKARVKAKGAEGSDKFGAANAAERVLKNSKGETDNVRGEVDMKALKGYFDNLADASSNDKSVLEQLVANNTNLVVTNEELVAIVKRLSNKNKDLQRETYCPKKTGGSRATQGKRDLTLSPH